MNPTNNFILSEHFHPEFAIGRSKSPGCRGNATADVPRVLDISVGRTRRGDRAINGVFG
jgi:hypothetical protein